MDDFESTPDFQALVVAATGKPERSMGDSVIPAEPPAWSDVRRLANSLMADADKQLPLHIYAVQAEANVNGFRGFHDALQSMLQLLQEHWDDMYPEPDMDDPDDMYYARVNLVNELSGQPAFLEAIYRLPLVSVRGIGDFSTRDLDIAAGTVTGTSEEQARCQEGLIKGAFAESEATQLQDIADALGALPQMCQATEEHFSQKTGQQNVLSLDSLKARIKTCASRFHEYADEHLASPVMEEEPTSDNATQENEALLSDAPAPKGSLTNRAMVNAAFNSLLSYYQQHEPSSPVRVLISRAMTFVDISFFEVAQALAPSQQDDLPALLQQLQNQPLAALLSDSYARHCSGETLPILTQSSPVAEAPTYDASASDPDTEVMQTGATAVSDSSGNNHRGVEINSRKQVLETLHDIETYFLNAEPASPVPLIVADIRKLVNKRFEELVAEFSRLLPVAVAAE